MKKTILSFLLSVAFLSNAQTLIKFTQLERAAGATSVVVTGTSGALTYTPTFPVSKWTNDVPYTTTAAIAGTFVPYTGATGSVNLGTNTFSAGNSTFSNTISKGTFSSTGTSTLNGLTNLGNITTSGSSSVGTTFTATGASVLTGGVTSPTLYGTSSSLGVLNLMGNSNSTNGYVNIGNAAINTQTNSKIRLAPTSTEFLDLGGDGAGTFYLWNHRGGSKTTSNYFLAGDEYDMLYNDSSSHQFRFSNTTVLNLTNSVLNNAGTTFFKLSPRAFQKTTFVEYNDFIVLASAIGFSTSGATLTTYRQNLFGAKTYSATSASTITNVYNSWFAKGIASSSMALINNWGFGTDGSALVTQSLVIGGAAITPSAALHVLGNGILKHLIGGSTAPTITSGSGLGTGAGTVVSVTNATDLSGVIGVVTGTLSLGTSAVLATITFNAAYGVAPNVIIQPANLAAADLIIGTNVYPTSSTTTMNINTNTVALTASTTYSWFYHIIQ